VLVAPDPHQDIEHGAILIDRAPQGVLPAVDGHEDPVQMPRVARARTTATERIRVGLTEFSAPPADRLVAHDHPSLRQQLLDITVAEGEPEVPPHSVTADRGREAVALIDGSGSLFFHTPSIASQAC